MIESHKKYSVIILFLQFCILIFFIFSYFSKPTELVYCVDNQKLFDNFLMTKEVKKSGEKEFNKLKKTTDSLYQILQKPNINTTLKAHVSQKYIMSSDQFEAFNQNFANVEVNKIWDRIAAYSKEYCKAKGYTVVIGKEHVNDVLYVDERRDVTNELLSYINSRYDGKE